MSLPCCCQDIAESSGRRRASRWRDAVGWLAPAATLALMPKCPMCVAAYLALATGIGVSLPVATAVRTALVVGCAASLAFMAIRTVARSLVRE